MTDGRVKGSPLPKSSDTLDDVCLDLNEEMPVNWWQEGMQMRLKFRQKLLVGEGKSFVPRCPFLSAYFAPAPALTGSGLGPPSGPVESRRASSALRSGLLKQ